jgi:hypothetical protein
MKRALLTLAMGVLLAGLAGCSHGPGCHGALCRTLFGVCDQGTCQSAPETCTTCQPRTCPTCQPQACAPCQPCPKCQSQKCGSGGLGKTCLGHCCLLGTGHEEGAEVINAGPPVGQITYPYYTTRGPRDYFARSPSSIGP